MSESKFYHLGCNLMYRWTIVLISLALLGGCGSIQKDQFMKTSADLLARTGEALSKIGERTPTADPSTVSTPPKPPKRDELADLFDQPYIDPLTRYLIKHGDEADRSAQLARVRRERDRRCQAIADNFNEAAKTREALERYQAGYSFSCPDQVADYEQALAVSLARQADARENKPETVSNKQPNSELSEQLSDCYLLTTIRNFSDALKVCKAPAEAGDVQAQTNLALISHALADYGRAHHWARLASAHSGEAAFLLARMYTAGQGVEPDPVAAEKWYHRAAGQGHAGAKAVLEEGTNTRGKTITQ